MYRKFQALASAARMRAARAAKSTSLAVLALSMLVHERAMADLPTVATPDGVAGGDFIALIKAFAKSGIGALILIVGAMAFLGVASGALVKWKKYRDGQIEATDLKEYFVVGSIMLVIVVAILLVATGII